MTYIPILADLSGCNVLLVGGGRVALRKAQALLPGTGHILAVAPFFCRELLALSSDSGPLTCRQREFEESDLCGSSLVILASNDTALHEHILSLCKARGIPVSMAAEPEQGDFIFPAVHRDGSLILAVSTSGASPHAAVWLRDRLAEAVPEHFSSVLDFLSRWRAPAQLRISDPEARNQFFQELFQLRLDCDQDLPDAVIDAWLSSYATHHLGGSS